VLHPYYIKGTWIYWLFRTFRPTYSHGWVFRYPIGVHLSAHWVH